MHPVPPSLPDQGGGRVLFRSNTLLVRAHLGRGADLAMVVFDPMTDTLSLDRPAFGEGFFAAYGIDAVHVLSTRNHWYQHPELPEAMASIRAAVASYPRVVTYGSSMGGYAALRFSAAVGAQAAIAISPQYAMRPGESRFERRWRGLRREAAWLHEVPGQPLPPLGAGTLFFDDREADGRHAAAILRDLPGLQVVALPYAGHPAGALLAETGLLSAAVLDAAHGRLDVGKLQAAVRRERHRSGQYLFTLARRQPPHRMQLKARLAERAVAARPDEPVYLSYAGLLLESLGRGPEAEAYHRRATARHGAPGLADLRFARFLWRAGRAEEAMPVFARAFAALPRIPVDIVALVAALDGRPADALAALAASPRLRPWPGGAASLRRLGRARVTARPEAAGVGRWLARRALRGTVLDPRNIAREIEATDND